MLSLYEVLSPFFLIHFARCVIYFSFHKFPQLFPTFMQFLLIYKSYIYSSTQFIFFFISIFLIFFFFFHLMLLSRLLTKSNSRTRKRNLVNSVTSLFVKHMVRGKSRASNGGSQIFLMARCHDTSLTRIFNDY